MAAAYRAVGQLAEAFAQLAQAVTRAAEQIAEAVCAILTHRTPQMAQPYQGPLVCQRGVNVAGGVPGNVRKTPGHSNRKDSK